VAALQRYTRGLVKKRLYRLKTCYLAVMWACVFGYKSRPSIYSLICPWWSRRAQIWVWFSLASGVSSAITWKK
jgi:hypothetical protein